ncbi:MAG TPA: DUF4235 domain-containing protein [Acidimicrobiales bacterium]|nr:DUF4235 domain-containing protein [Acidimicrobiales bacterium]
MDDRGVLWKLVALATGAAAGAATRAVLHFGWRRAKGSEPPANPASPRTSWPEAVTWAAASGVAMAVTRLVAQRGAAEAWKARTGSYPAGLETVTP